MTIKKQNENHNILKKQKLYAQNHSIRNSHHKVSDIKLAVGPYPTLVRSKPPNLVYEPRAAAPLIANWF